MGIVKIVIGLFFLLNSTVSANEFDGYSQVVKTQVEKLKNYMAKNKRCYLAFLEVEDLSKSQEFESPWMSRLFCIADVTRGKGIDAKTGCFVLQYDAQKDLYHDIYKIRSQPEPPYLPKGCEKVFSLLMNKEIKWLHTDKKKYTPWEYLLDSQGKYGCMVRRHLIYAETQAVANAFNSQNSKYHKKISSQCQSKKARDDKNTLSPTKPTNKDESQSREEEKIIKEYKQKKKKQEENQREFEVLYE